jgi:hypothetical protein
MAIVECQQTLQDEWIHPLPDSIRAPGVPESMKQSAWPLDIQLLASLAHIPERISGGYFCASASGKNKYLA